MSLADAASTRKERLLTLRKRKAGQDDGGMAGDGYGLLNLAQLTKVHTFSQGRTTSSPIEAAQL